MPTPARCADDAAPGPHKAVGAEVPPDAVVARIAAGRIIGVKEHEVELTIAVEIRDRNPCSLGAIPKPARYGDDAAPGPHKAVGAEVPPDAVVARIGAGRI